MVCLPCLSFTSACAAENDANFGALKQSLAVYQNLATLEVGFIQKKSLSSIGTTLESSGRLKITDHPKLIVWEILKPAPLRIELRDSKMKIITAPGSKNESVQLLDANEGGAKGSAAQAELSAWMSLDANSISDQYNITQKNKNEFEFHPKGKSAFSSINVKLTRLGNLQDLNLHEVSGDTLALTFGKPQLSYKKPSSQKKSGN
jgi:hypothetical protein